MVDNAKEISNRRFWRPSPRYDQGNGNFVGVETKRDVHKKLRNSTYHKKALFNYLVSYGRPLNHIRVSGSRT